LPNIIMEEQGDRRSEYEQRLRKVMVGEKE
jgi:hypothetical protein